MAALRNDLAEAVNQSGDTDADAGLGRPSLIRVSVLVVFVVGTVVAGYRFRTWTEPFAELRGWLQQPSGAGALLFLILFPALNTVGIPAPVLGAAGGGGVGGGGGGGGGLWCRAVHG